MKKLVLALGLVATLVGNVTAAVFTFDSISLGTFQASTPPPIVTATINHPAVTVNLPFEFASMVATQDANFGTLPPTGTAHFTFTAPDNDVLRGDWNVVFGAIPNPLGLTAVGTFTFTGGTGMFDGATGGGSLTALVLFSDPTLSAGTSTVVWNGQVALVPEPSTIALGSVGLVLLVLRKSRRS